MRQTNNNNIKTTVLPIAMPETVTTFNHVPPFCDDDTSGKAPISCKTSNFDGDVDGENVVSFEGGKDGDIDGSNEGYLVGC